MSEFSADALIFRAAPAVLGGAAAFVFAFGETEL